ncbi:hypothetical protein ACJU26_11730 [Acidithiobacillus sp. M4-SHS-6]|uniref:hypothetical protein n=1 Tax=Acidithiobacillus sp. M4-SHS-6 TaxID=3383024 RepID=UPI0039BDE3B4
MATIVKNPSGTWKTVIHKQCWPTTAKTFRTRRDADDWARQSEDEMVRGVYIRRSTSQKLTVDIALDRCLRKITPTKKESDSQKRDHTSAKVVRKRLLTWPLKYPTMVWYYLLMGPSGICAGYRGHRLSVATG